MPKIVGSLLRESDSRDAFDAGANAGGGSSPVEIVLDFGAYPVSSKSFSFTTTATLGNKVVMVPSADIDGDELEMDGFMCAARVTATDTVEAFITAFPGPVTGQRKFNLLIG